MTAEWKRDRWYVKGWRNARGGMEWRIGCAQGKTKRFFEKRTRQAAQRIIRDS